MGIACCTKPPQSDSPMTNITVKLECNEHLSERENSCFSSSNCKYETTRKPFLSKISEKNKRKKQCKIE